MGKTEKQRLVEHLVAHSAIQTYRIAILHRPARPDVMPFDARLAPLGEHRITRKFGAAIAHDHARLAAPCDQCVEFANDPLT